MNKIFTPVFLMLLLFGFSIKPTNAQTNHLVISQVYGGGGNSGATYTNDFIEIFNPTSSPVSVTGWSLQYASSAGTSWAVTNLSGIIPSGGYYLVQQQAGAGGTTPLPTPDATGNIAMAAGAGKVALVSNSTSLTGACPVSSLYVDLVGYGTAATCFEGTGTTATISATIAAFRAGNGCTDTDNNNADFTTRAPAPRNSASPLNPCTITANTVSVTAVNNAAEPATNGSFTINFSAATTATTNINFAFTGTALFGTDYNVSYSTGVTASTTASGTLTVPSGTTQVTVTITPINDAIKEVDETIILTLSLPTNSYVLGTATATILLEDDDITNVDVAAGINAAEPFTNGTFIINLSDPAPAAGTRITYSLSGTATRGVDYSDALNGVITIPSGSTTGTITLTTIDDLVYEGTETIIITLNTVPAGNLINTATATINLSDNEAIPAIKINEVYGGGGSTNSSTPFKNDFIELYNPGSVAVNLNGWSVQYGSSGGTTWSGKTILTGTIQPNGYYLVQQGGGTTGADLPTPDDIGGIGMSATNGKVALVSNSTTLTGACPTGYVDLVGYGSANCFEGAGPTAGLSNTTSAERTPKGFDTNNNNTDFTVGAPTPKNSFVDLTAPVIFSTVPADNATNVSTSFIASITFDENVQKGTGTIVLKNAVGVVVKTIDVASDLVTVAGKVVSFEINSLLFNTGYYFEVSAGAFVDFDNNIFAGLSGSTAWNFTTLATPPMGVLNVTYNLNNCTGSTLTDGFTQYNVTGAQIWSCTAFGRDPNNPLASAPSAFQMNGYAGGKDNTNTDWLISPAFDLTGSNFPLLSFWSRTAFTGDALQLKVSTDYTGTGDPSLATWTDLNGKFPSVVSDVWTLSENINLSAYKSAQTYFAFVYNSSTEDGARWTLDDITVTNSATAPPPSLTVSATDIQYTFVASGSVSDKTFTFTGNDLTGAVTLTSTGAFLLSKDGSSFSPSLTYTIAEANNITKTVYLRFAPTAANQNFVGIINISTSGTATNTINVKGSSIDPATTLEVVNWNIEWFGSPSLGPVNDDLQQQNVTTMMATIGADIYGLVEVVDESRLQAVVNGLNAIAGAGTYNYVIGNYGSHTLNPTNPSPISEAQKHAYVYKTSVFSNVTTRTLIDDQNTSSTSYNSWSSGRYPFVLNADVTLNCVTTPMMFILVHAKANTAPLATSYARRLAASNELYDTINTHFADANVIILGDLNDDLDQSITTGFTTTSYSAFTTDPVNFFSPTLSLSLAGKKSTVSYNDVIDHVIISNELVPNYLPASATILTDVASNINKYGSTTSDHYPVFTRYRFANTTAPTVNSCTETVSFCSTSSASYSVPVFTATDDCADVVSYTYTITGATTRTGTSNDASGLFNIGSSTVIYTATDSWGNAVNCSTTVVVNEPPVITIPDVFVLPQGTAVNTVYIGYAPASTLQITATATGGTGNYIYNWSTAGGLAIVAGTADLATVKVYATGSGNYATELLLTVTDGKGCSSTIAFTVNVIDVRGGNKNDKVIVCHNGGSNGLIVAGNAVAAHLAHGDMLGGCSIPTASNFSGHKTTTMVSDNAADEVNFSINNFPNPASNNTTIRYSLTVDSRVSIQLIDVMGKVVATVVNANRKAGVYNTNLDLTNIPAGIYFCRYSTNSTLKQTAQTIKIAVVK